MDKDVPTSSLAPIKHAIPTLEVLNAAVSRLNRQSVIALLDQLGEAIETCCEDDLSADQVRALARSEIEGFDYTKNQTSLVDLIQQEIDRFDYAGSKSSTFGTYIRTSFENYDYRQSLTFKLAVDGRISSFNYSPVVDARIASYNYAPVFEKYLTTYDFRKANDSFTIALNGYLASFDFLNLTNNSFHSLVESRITSYDFRKSNNTFNTAVEARIANYDFREILTRFLANYDFKGFVSPTFEAFIDSRIKSYSMTTHAALMQFFQTTINKFDFSACINLTNVINAAIANYSFTNHTTLTQVFTTRIDEYDFSTNTSLRVYLQNNNAEVRGWIDAAILPLAQSFQVVDRARIALEGRFNDVRVQINDFRDEIDSHQAAINSLRLALENIENLAGIKSEIEKLQRQLEQAVALAGELDEHELGQVRRLFYELLGNDESAAIILRSVRIRIHDQSRSLLEVIDALASADQIERVFIEYPENEADPRLIKGCTYVLTDGTKVHFDCIHEAMPEGGLRLEFRTSDWKGVGASFTNIFARRSTRRRVCKREVTLDWYEPVQSTNVVFTL